MGDLNGAGSVLYSISWSGKRLLTSRFLPIFALSPSPEFLSSIPLLLPPSSRIAPPPSLQPFTRHTLNCLVQNEPGVLSRVSGILAARGFNIDSLVVCATEIEDLSRMCIVLRGQDGVIEQARRQLEDLVSFSSSLKLSLAIVHCHGSTSEGQRLMNCCWYCTGSRLGSTRLHSYEND